MRVSMVLCNRHVVICPHRLCVPDSTHMLVPLRRQTATQSVYTRVQIHQLVSVFVVYAMYIA